MFFQKSIKLPAIIILSIFFCPFFVQNSLAKLPLPTLTAKVMGYSHIWLVWQFPDGYIPNASDQVVVLRSSINSPLTPVGHTDTNVFQYDDMNLKDSTAYSYKVCMSTDLSRCSSIVTATTRPNAKKIAAMALIQFASPSTKINPVSFDLATLTDTQVNLLNNAIVSLQGQKFIVVNGQVYLGNSVKLSVVRNGDIVSLNVNSNTGLAGPTPTPTGTPTPTDTPTPSPTDTPAPGQSGAVLANSIVQDLSGLNNTSAQCPASSSWSAGLYCE